MDTFTPSALAHHHLDDVLSCLPGALDGRAESIHQARIATRRLREVLPLLTTAAAHTDTIRSAGRHLGRVRELDVMESLIDVLLRQAPSDGATVLLQVRQALWARQRMARRAMVKALERLDLSALKAALAPHRRGLRRWLSWRDRGAEHGWAQTIWTRVLARSEEAVDAARRAPGIYLPERAHQARIAVKKLRYAVEVATETGVWRPKRMLKDLRRLQQSLGEAHDAQVLLDSLDELLPDDTTDVGKPRLKQALEVEIERHHAAYSQRRERIFHIAAACSRAAARSGRHRLSRRVIAATALTTVPLVAALHNTPRTLRLTA